MSGLVAAVFLLGTLPGPAADSTARGLRADSSASLQPADTAAPARCSLTIRTGADSASVYLDSVRAGRTPLTIDALRGGSHVIRLVQEDTTSWLTGSITDTVYLSPGESRTLRYAFERRVMVVTDPSGALVYIGDSAAGTTPLMLTSLARPLPSDVNVVRSGYESTIVPLPGSGSGVARAVLHKMWQSEPPESPFMSESGSSERTGLRLYVAGGLTVAAGAAAAYFKIKADGRNELYQESGNPAFRDETRRLDVSAAIALVATQIGFAFFTYYLLSD
ncbi:MAG TPA: PEGA domain-containing protein [Bacteroidota bacterium]|nr:PEGA domain-containing protein [Bacteroidota bacterium]